MPSSFERLAHRKGFVRYMSPELRQLAGSLSEAKQDLEVALSGVLKVPLAGGTGYAPCMLPPIDCSLPCMLP